MILTSFFESDCSVSFCYDGDTEADRPNPLKDVETFPPILFLKSVLPQTSDDVIFTTQLTSRFRK